MFEDTIRFATDTLESVRPRIAQRFQAGFALIENWAFICDHAEMGEGKYRLFRYDEKRLRRIILAAEHMVRCFIILLAFTRARETPITPVRFTLTPGARNFGSRAKTAPLDHQAELRCIPMYEVKPPAFTISLPGEAGKSDICSGKTARRRYARPRNDDKLNIDRLWLRLERLPDLLKNAKIRADRIARIWAGMLTPKIARHKRQKRLKAERPDDPSILTFKPPAFEPLKDWRPPPFIMEGADETEQGDIISLHYAAGEAAKGIYALCG